MHPDATAEYVRQHRASLEAQARQQRLAKLVRRERDQSTVSRRLAASAVLLAQRIRALATALL
jgi:hypothetical protein